MGHFGDYQNEIYLAGLKGHQPRFPIRFEELEAKAHAALPESLVSYVAGGCGNERTQDANVTAFDDWGAIPRMLVGAKQRSLAIDLFGMMLPSPVFMSPIGVIGLCAADGHGDVAVARAAAVTGVPMMASTLTVEICHPDDARRAIDGGVDGIYCSNHGGRQANGGLAAIDLLPDIVEAAINTPVLFDSGIRTGVDIIKALALGAHAVGIGRPYAYGLALGGVDGVVHVLRCLLAEADLYMAVDGYSSRADLTRDMLRRAHYRRK